ncbi:MAG: MFS transporter [Bacteroidales bacterium]|nr:MFS transporter [Bacteroidales bacterium]
MSSKKTEVNYTGPFITMVVLMSLVGFLTVINQQFQAPLQKAFLSNAGDLKNTLSTFITFSFFLAYLLMGGVSAKMVDKIGYRATLVRALGILILGLGLFEASAFQFDQFGTMVSIGAASVPVAYFIFLIGSFVVGTSMTFLQVVVNPYLVACSVPGTSSVQRQTIAGAGNSTMATIAPLFVASIIFQGKTEIQIGSLYIPFAVLMVVVGIIAISLSKIHLPEIEGTTAGKDEKLEKSIWSFNHLTLGVIAIFFYVGVEVAVGANINLYAESLGFLPTAAAQMAFLYWGGMLVGRLFGSFVSKIPGNVQLTVTSIGAGLLVIASVFTGNPWLLVGVGIFHSIMWPAIFSLAIDGLGKYTSKGSGALMLGVVGGAILPFVQGIAADAMGGWNLTWIIVIVGEAYLLYYALVGSKIKQ